VAYRTNWVLRKNPCYKFFKLPIHFQIIPCSVSTPTRDFARLSTIECGDRGSVRQSWRAKRIISLYFSLLSGIWPGDGFAGDCALRHAVCTTENCSRISSKMARVRAISRFKWERNGQWCLGTAVNNGDFLYRPSLSLNRSDSREQERQVPAYLHLWDEGKGTGFQRRFP
jgi:hypothetical protein